MTNRDERALQLIGQTYRAAIGEVNWQDWVAGLSDAYQGALVCLSVESRATSPGRQLYTSGLKEDFGRSLERCWLGLLPWEEPQTMQWFDRFVSTSIAFPDSGLRQTEFYKQWMEPRGLPAVWPLGLVIMERQSRPDAAIMILRQPRSQADFSEQELQFGNQLLPHLKRAFDLHAQASRIEWSRRALQEVVERMRLAVVLLDAEGHLIMANRSADRILATREGLELREGKLFALRPDDDRKLQQTIERARKNGAQRRFALDEFVDFSADPGRRGLEFIVKPLMSGAPGSTASDAVVAVLFASPDEVSTFRIDEVRRIYSLTRAEAELVQLLTAGASLGEAAHRRHVSVATVRSQLKSTFSKTATASQSELVQLILASDIALWDAEVAGQLAARWQAPGEESDE